MIVNVPTRDVGAVRDVFRRECEYVRGLENFNEDYIKLELGIFE